MAFTIDRIFYCGLESKKMWIGLTIMCVFFFLATYNFSTGHYSPIKKRLGRFFRCILDLFGALWRSLLDFSRSFIIYGRTSLVYLPHVNYGFLLILNFVFKFVKKKTKNRHDSKYFGNFYVNFGFRRI